MNKSIPRIPTSAAYTGFPVRGTIIAVLCQRSFATWPTWIWGVMWTVMVLLWIICIADFIVRDHIPEDRWRAVFGGKP